MKKVRNIFLIISLLAICFVAFVFAFINQKRDVLEIPIMYKLSQQDREIATRKLKITQNYLAKFHNHQTIIKKLVLIGIDGLPSWLLKEHPALFKNLLKNSVYTFEAENEYQYSTLSAANWATLYSGTHPQEHGIYSVNFTKEAKNNHQTIYYNKPANHPTVEYHMNPTFLYQFKKKYPHSFISSVDDWGMVNRLFERKLFPDYRTNQFQKTNYQNLGNSDRYLEEHRDVINAMTSSKILKYVFQNNHKIIANFHMGGVDAIGHGKGPMPAFFGSDTQISYIKMLDLKLSAIIQTMQEMNQHRNDLMFVIVSDHGGIKNARRHGDFGTTSKSENNKWVKNIPMIFINSQIKGRNVLQGQIKNINFAATVANLMNFETRYFWQGGLNLTNLKIYPYQIF